MSKVRVLVVDDSVVIRRVVSEELGAVPGIEVVGSAANGLIALAKMTQVNPDLVVLDVEMPDMDGLETLRRLRQQYPRLPVIMFSSLTERGAKETLEALALGASDYFPKPSGPNGLDGSRRIIREELAPAIKALCKPVASPGPPPPPAVPPVAGRVELVVIGTSTGGPNALADVFGGLPAGMPVPILVVQHMPPIFTRLMAERLSAISRVPTAEAVSGTVLEPGKAWVAPGDWHMKVVRDAKGAKLLLDQEPPEHSCRPAADPLFRSAAKAYGSGCLAVVLTGMGQDGLRGCEAVRAAGGQVLAQDEATSVVWGMPGFVARAGLANKILPLSLIGNEIARLVGASASRRGQ